MNDSSLFGLGEKTLAMGLERNIRSYANKAYGPNSGIKSNSVQNQNQGIATLLVMIAVLTIIVLFCCFSAPGIRGLCKKYIFRSCPYDDPDVDNVNTAISEIAPTVILLPNNRMIVVDHHVYAQLQATQWGIDLLELGENVIRHQNLPLTDSTPSILDSEVSTTSKGLSPTSLGYGPPAYEEIFGLKDVDLPPSYSTVSFILKNNIELSEKTVDLGNDSQSNSVVNDNENSV